MITRKSGRREITGEGFKVIDNYYNYRTKLNIPITHPYLDKLAENLIDECLNNDKLLCLNSMLVHFGLRVFPYYHWVKVNDNMERAHATCLLIMGARRENRALERNAEGKAFTHLQHLYCKDWNEANMYHAKLKDEQISKIPDIVEIPVFKKECDCGTNIKISDDKE